MVYASPFFLLAFEVITMGKTMIWARFSETVFVFVFVIALVVPDSSANRLTVICDGCKAANCFRFNSVRSSFECRHCLQSYTPPQVFRSFNRLVTHGASVSSENRVVKLTSRPVSSYDQESLVQLFCFSWLHHNVLLIHIKGRRSGDATTEVITQEMVESILVGTDPGITAQAAFDKLQKAMVMAILMALYHRPKLANNLDDLRLEVMTLLTVLYNQFQHSNPVLANAMFTHGFNDNEQQGYISIFQDLESQINQPPSLIQDGLTDLWNINDILYARLGQLKNGYHFFNLPHFGIGALIHKDEQWVLVCNTGMIITAPKEDIALYLADAYTGNAVDSSRQTVSIVALGILALSGAVIGSVVGILTSNLPSRDLSDILFGAGIGAIIGGAIFVAGCSSDSSDLSPGYSDSTHREEEDSDDNEGDLKEK